MRFTNHRHWPCKNGLDHCFAYRMQRLFCLNHPASKYIIIFYNILFVSIHINV